MDPDQPEPGGPIAGSPEVRNVISDPLGPPEPRASRGHADVSYEDASNDSDYGRFDKNTGRFQ